MAHFAEVNDRLEVVRVLVVADAQEHRGNEYLSMDLGLGGRWYKTSYNTIGGVHQLGGTPYRKNFAGIGYTFDRNRQAFIPPKCHEEAVLDEATCLWVCTNQDHTKEII
jgi:hypothetical protein